MVAQSYLSMALPVVFPHQIQSSFGFLLDVADALSQQHGKLHHGSTLNLNPEFLPVCTQRPCDFEEAGLYESSFNIQILFYSLVLYPENSSQMCVCALANPNSCTTKSVKCVCCSEWGFLASILESLETAIRTMVDS